jgi:hypothetical protein
MHYFYLYKLLFYCFFLKRYIAQLEHDIFNIKGKYKNSKINQNYNNKIEKTIIYDF